MTWTTIISILMGGVSVATMLEIIQYKRHKRSSTLAKIEPPDLTQVFLDGYYNDVIRKTQTPPKTNCPNCGAPLENGKCSYCGTKVSHTVSMDELTQYLNEGYKIHKVL